MSVYRRNNVYHYDFAVNGVRYRGSTKQSTETRAKKAEDILRAKALNDDLLIGKVPTLREFSERFLEWVGDTNELEKKSKEYYIQGWKLLSATKLTDKRLNAINNDQAHMVTFPDSASNGNNALRTLRRMFGKAIEWSVIRRRPIINLLKETGRTMLLDTAAELTLLAVAKQPLADVIVIVRDTGMRPEEIFRLRLEYVMWERKCYHNPHGKTDQARRFVPLSNRLLDVLKRRAAGRTEGWVFPSKRAAEGHLATVTKQFQQARKDAGLPAELVLYCGRHDFGTYALEETGNIAAVMTTMGQSSVQTAMKYQHPGLDSVRDAINLRNEEMRSAQEKALLEMPATRA